MHCGALNLIALEFCRVIDGDRDPAAVLLKVPESRLQEYVANGESAAVQNALEGYRDDIGLPVSGAGRKRSQRLRSGTLLTAALIIFILHRAFSSWAALPAHGTEC